MIPIIVGGILDIDSPVIERFNKEDAAGLEKCFSILLNFID